MGDKIIEIIKASIETKDREKFGTAVTEAANMLQTLTTKLPQTMKNATTIRELLVEVN